MPKEPKKKEEDKSSDTEVTIPVLEGFDIIFVKLRVVTDKNGKLVKTRMTWPNGVFIWAHYNKDGKPVSGSGGGKGWVMDTIITYDREGRKKSTKTTTKRGGNETLTTQKFDPKTGKMTEEHRKTKPTGIEGKF